MNVFKELAIVFLISGNVLKNSQKARFQAIRCTGYNTDIMLHFQLLEKRFQLRLIRYQHLWFLREENGTRAGALAGVGPTLKCTLHT